MNEYSRRQILGHLFGLAIAGQAIAQPPEDGGAARRAPRAGGHPGVDRIMESILDEMHIAGGSIAFCHRGELTFSRGYGLADVERQVAVKPDTLFSTASVSKSITGVGVLKLVADGRLALDARMVEVLHDLGPLPGQQIVDPRFQEITVHQLLYHGGVSGSLQGPRPRRRRRGRERTRTRHRA